MEEYQLKVVVEKAELDIKILKLLQFIQTPSFNSSLLIEEQTRLKKQLSIMVVYSDILAQRIAAFKP